MIKVSVIYEVAADKSTDAKRIQDEISSAMDADSINWSGDAQNITLNAYAESEEVFREELQKIGPYIDKLVECCSMTDFQIQGPVSDDLKEALAELNPSYF